MPISILFAFRIPFLQSHQSINHSAGINANYIYFTSRALHILILLTLYHTIWNIRDKAMLYFWWFNDFSHDKFETMTLGPFGWDRPVYDYLTIYRTENSPCVSQFLHSVLPWCIFHTVQYKDHNLKMLFKATDYDFSLHYSVNKNERSNLNCFVLNQLGNNI